MNSNELELRTKAFAVRVIKFVARLPKRREADVLGYQLLKSGTSIGANYREARSAESTDDFIHKIGIVEKEAKEIDLPIRDSRLNFPDAFAIPCVIIIQ